MKKKLLYLLLLFTLCFTAGCSKEETPEPTPTQTPTPTPENLAMASLTSMETLFNLALENDSSVLTDTDNGMGYDINLTLELGQGLTALMNTGGLTSMGLNGSIDMKENLAVNLILSLNQEAVLEGSVFTDFTNVLLNLPRYSDIWISGTFEELLGISAEELTSAFDSEAAGLPTNEEILNLYKNYLHRFVSCFKAQTDITENVTIGTGAYTLTGQKHTVTASMADLSALYNDLVTELEQYSGLEITAEKVTENEYTTLYLNYYINEEGSFAWECYPDNLINGSLSLIYTANGFCLSSIDEEGISEVIIYSERTSDTAGTLVIPGSEGSEDVTLYYTLEDDSMSLYGAMNGLEMALSCTVTGDLVQGEFDITVEGISLLCNFSQNAKKSKTSMELNYFGMTIGTLTVETTSRDYTEIVMPARTADTDTWLESLDQTLLMADLEYFSTKYPFLSELFYTEEEPEEDDWEDNKSSTYDSAEAYTNAFSGMTGYSVDEDGWVYFHPLEEEILAMGQPSTAVDTIVLTDEQRTALHNYAATAYADYEVYIDSNYTVYGYVQYDMVRSEYLAEYYYEDTTNWNNCIIYDIEAFTGGLNSITVYNSSKEEALRMLNDLLAILNVDYAVTAEAAENYESYGNLYFSGYDGGDYYGVGFYIEEY